MEIAGVSGSLLDGNQHSGFRLSFEYTSDEAPNQTTGLLLLARKGDSFMEGRWIEQTARGEIHWGSSRWSKEGRKDQEGRWNTRAPSSVSEKPESSIPEEL